MAKVFGIIVTLILVGVIAVIAKTNPRPHDARAIKAYAHQLFAFGAIRYVHGLDSDRRAAQQSLFDRVAAGAELTATESCIYRRTYWMILHDYAGRFQMADDDLHLATDYGITHPNNCEGMGILGVHDLHDISAAQNFAQLISHLEKLETGAGWVRSIVLVNEINKNLVDLTVHFAPAVHSIGVIDPDFMQTGRLAGPYNAMQSGFKTAQFARVNSDAYWAAVDDALDAYTQIIRAAQDVTTARTSPLQRRIAGRWLSLQTVAPRLSLSDCTRPRPNPVAPMC